MSEKEKMLAGKYYIASDEELTQDRLRSKVLCNRFNQLIYPNSKEHHEILEQLFNLGDLSNINIEPSFYCDYGYNIEFNGAFYSNHNLVILDVCKVSFGKDVLIGPNVGIYTASHPIDPVDRQKSLEFGSPISVGDNVWIGGGASICAGVSIGDNSIIGAGSVLTKNVPSNTVFAGVPAKFIKNI